MATLPARAAKLLTRLLIKRNTGTPDQIVRHLKRMLGHALPAWMPVGVTLRTGMVAGVPGQWLEVKHPQTTLLYLHGGAFVTGALGHYHAFCGQLALQLNANIFLADYRLAPEHPFPAAVDDAFAVYRELINNNPAARPLIVAGDSAGGNLTLVTLLRARDENLPMPNCAVTLSPATDATATLPSISANSRTDAMLSGSMIEKVAAVYLAGQDATQPYASPSRGDFTGLPPLLFTVSEEECLRDDTYAAATKARLAGVAVEILSRPDMPHVWPILWLFLPEARTDMQVIVRFIDKYR